MGRVLVCLWALAGCSEYAIEGKEGDEPRPSALLEADPGRIDFGDLDHAGPVAQVFTVTSVGDVGVTIEGLEIEGTGAYTATWVDAPEQLQPGQSASVTVTYVPESGLDLAQAVVLSDADNPQLFVDLSGAGVFPALTIEPPELLLRSSGGLPVSGEVWLESTGTADLDLTGLALAELDWTAEADIPTSLAPGEGIPLTITWTPQDPSSEAQVWLTTNTANGVAVVPVQGEMEPPCMGLAEAWQLGALAVQTTSTGLLQLTNEGDAHDVCMDTWYVFISEDTQDMGAGDPAFDPGGEYPLGSIRLAAGESEHHVYQQTSIPAWWCIEETQYTEPTFNWWFIGGRVPSHILSLMLDGDQEAIWAHQETNPLIVVGREANVFEMAGTNAATVTVSAINMGQRSTSAWVSDTIPVGFAGGGWTIEPSGRETLSDGSYRVWWQLDFEAAIPTGTGAHTIYDIRQVSYNLSRTTSDCPARTYYGVPTAEWNDSDGSSRSSEGSPLLVTCTPED